MRNAAHTKGPYNPGKRGQAPAAQHEARMALVSTPWPMFDRPSIQLGALKAYLNAHCPDIHVDAWHVYLNVAQSLGYPCYAALSERSWIAECPYAALLYPDRMETVARFWKRKVNRHPLLAPIDFRELCAQIEAVSLHLIDTIAWDRYLLTGYSISLAQLTSSLYFIREIKRHAPRLPVVVGGSACAGRLGESLIRAIPEIDYVIGGEGERPLLDLIRTIRSGNDTSRLPGIPGLIHESSPQFQETFRQIQDLDELPTPDYRDYFRILKESNHGPVFMPKLPMEISRGCWWHKGGSSQAAGGCTFCNLNLQWHGYRAKSLERTVSEIATLVSRHQVLSIYFMDNLLPAKGLLERFQAIEHLGKDLELHCEIRAHTPRDVLGAMASAGMREVQVGIEALSTRLLKKLNKGTTAMDNLEIMKNCEDAHLPKLTGNLILGFPSSDSRDVSETLAHLSFAFPFRPLNGVDLWLGYGSRLWQEPDTYGIRLKGNHPHYRHLLPAAVLGKLRLMMQGYDGPIRHQRRIWEPVRKKIAEWADQYTRLHQEPGFQPILSYRDGGSFLIIRERRPHDDTRTHRLTGTSRAIYQFCETQRPMAEILDRFPQFREEKIRPFLRMMVNKRLMFTEGDRFLSLAVKSGPC